tara:strand:+ start:470 stop:619 length:150 start_codon:yes stop_codon:yes gene_type:complete
MEIMALIITVYLESFDFMEFVKNLLILYKKYDMKKIIKRYEKTGYATHI